MIYHVYLHFWTRYIVPVKIATCPAPQIKKSVAFAVRENPDGSIIISLDHHMLDPTYNVSTLDITTVLAN